MQASLSWCSSSIGSQLHNTTRGSALSSFTHIVKHSTNTRGATGLDGESGYYSNACPTNIGKETSLSPPRVIIICCDWQPSPGLKMMEDGMPLLVRSAPHLHPCFVQEVEGTPQANLTCVATSDQTMAVWVPLWMQERKTERHTHGGTILERHRFLSQHQLTH